MWKRGFRARYDHGLIRMTMNGWNAKQTQEKLCSFLHYKNKDFDKDFYNDSDQKGKIRDTDRTTWIFFYVAKRGPQFNRVQKHY